MKRCALFPMTVLVVLVVSLNPLEPAQVLFAKEPMQVSRSDLTVTDIGWNIYSPEVGDIIRFTAYVENQGTADTSAWGDVGVRFFIDGARIEDGFVSNILPGTTVSVDFYWRATAGNHTVRMFADYGDYVPENDEDNNDREEPFHVNSPPYHPGSPRREMGRTTCRSQPT